MIFDAIQEWFQELLIDGIISNLTGMFDTLNTKVGEIAGEVGMTPAAWNSGIFNMVRNLSETVIVPIASIVLTFVMCYELIQLIIERTISTTLTPGSSSSGSSRPSARCSLSSTPGTSSWLCSMWRRTW